MWKDKYPHYFEIKRGSYGVIFYVSNNLVVKELLPNAEGRDRRRFIREINILNKLIANPYVVDIFEFSTEDDLPWFVMPKAELNLYEFMEQQDNPLDEKTALAILEAIINAVEDAHNQDILHRDLAPSNILLFRNGTVFDIKVADFGIGRDYNSGSAPLTKSIDTNLGHDAFTAPEQLMFIDNATIKSDIYSLGALLSYVLTKKDPRYYKATSGLRAIVNKCMDINPQNRPTISELKKLIANYKIIVGSNKVTIIQVIENFNLLGKLSESELYSFSERMLKTKDYDRGDITYNLYFKSILDLPINLYKYWIKNTEVDIISQFADSYSKQAVRICHQVKWSFSSMKEIGDRLMIIFNEINDISIRTKIFETFVNIYDCHFGEVYEYIKQIVVKNYSSNDEIAAIAMVIASNKEILEPVFEDVQDNIHHYAFYEIFE